MRHRPTRAGAPLAPHAEPASGLRGGGALDGGARIHVPHELGDIVVGGPLEDVAARARLHDAPAFEDGDLVAELQGLVEIVTDEEDGLPDPLLERQQLVLELAADERVERRERLVHEQDVRIGRERPREPDALLHAAGELAAIALGPLREPDERQLLVDDAPALLGRVAPQLEPEADVVAHRPPRQQAELLEHHGDAQAANAAQRRRIAVHPDVDGRVAVAHQHLAACDEVQAVRRAQQRRLAGPRQAHEDRDLGPLDTEGCVRDADHDAGLLDDLAACAARIEQGERLPERRGAGAARSGAEQDVDGAELERCGHGAAALSAGRLMRSSTMASSTITKPASKPMPTWTVLSARTTGTPSPPAPTSAAITTMERLSMMHWVMPARIVGAALGSSTFHSSCIGVAPKARPASRSAVGTELMPS